MKQNLKQITISSDTKKFIINQVHTCSNTDKVLGLMFKSKNKANALLFQFEKPTKMKIHSFFVFFPFIALWLDDKNQIIEQRKISPFGFSFSPKRPYNKLIEIPLNDKYMSLSNAILNNSKP